MTEAEVISIINKIANRLAYKYRFGYYSIDDIKQQARLIAWTGLVKYDNIRPLENFLWTHIRNRLHNYKRDNFERPDKPCYNCPLKAYLKNTNSCKIYEDMLECNLYHTWINKNSIKRNLMEPIGFDEVDDENENNMHNDDEIVSTVANKEIYDIIDKYLPLVFRKDWLLLNRNARIPKQRRLKLEEAIKKIFREHIYEQEDW